MEINLSTYVPQAGDVLSWVSGEEKILFVVLENEVTSEKMIGATLFDTRQTSPQNHIVIFREKDWNYRLHLICKKNQAENDLDDILDDWRAQNE